MKPADNIAWSSSPAPNHMQAKSSPVARSRNKRIASCVTFSAAPSKPTIVARKVERPRELLLTSKHRQKTKRLEREVVKRLHSYEVPESSPYPSSPARESPTSTGRRKYLIIQGAPQVSDRVRGFRARWRGARIHVFTL